MSGSSKYKHLCVQFRLNASLLNKMLKMIKFMVQLTFSNTNLDSVSELSPKV